MSFLRHVSGKSGFSLIQVMVAIGIMSILGMTTLSLIQNANKSMALMSTKLDQLSLINEFQVLSQSETACLSAFQNSTPFNATQSATSTGQETQIRLPGNRIVAEQRNYGALRVTDLKFVNARKISDGINGTINYSTNLFLGAEATSQVLGPKAMKGRIVGSIFLVVNSARDIIACGPETVVEGLTANTPAALSSCNCTSDSRSTLCSCCPAGKSTAFRVLADTDCRTWSGSNASDRTECTYTYSLLCQPNN